MVIVYVSIDVLCVHSCVVHVHLASATFSHDTKLHCGLKYVFMSTYTSLSISLSIIVMVTLLFMVTPNWVIYYCRGGREHHYDRLKLRKKGGGGGGGSGAHHHHHHHHHHQGHPSSSAHPPSSATAPAKTHKVLYSYFTFKLNIKELLMVIAPSLSTPVC